MFSCSWLVKRDWITILIWGILKVPFFLMLVLFHGWFYFPCLFKKKISQPVFYAHYIVYLCYIRTIYLLRLFLAWLEEGTRSQSQARVMTNEQPNQDPCFVGWGRGHLIWSSQREVIDDIESLPTITAPLARSGLFLRQPLSKGGCIWCCSFRPLTGAIWV